MFRGGHHVTLVPINDSQDWKHYKFDPEQLFIHVLRVVGEEVQEIVSHGYRKNIMGCGVGADKLGKKIVKNLGHARLFVGVLWGIRGATSLF